MDLRDARIRAGLKQKDVAEMAGIFWTTLHRYEHGDKQPSQELLERILKAIQDNGQPSEQSLRGANLKVARIRAGLRQQDVAERVGISRMSILRYEQGKHWPSPEMLERILKAIQDNGHPPGQERG